MYLLKSLLLAETAHRPSLGTVVMADQHSLFALSRCAYIPAIWCTARRDACHAHVSVTNALQSSPHGNLHATAVVQLAKNVAMLLESAPPVTHGLQHGVDMQAARQSTFKTTPPNEHKHCQL